MIFSIAFFCLFRLGLQFFLYHQLLYFLIIRRDRFNDLFSGWSMRQTDLINQWNRNNNICFLAIKKEWNTASLHFLYKSHEIGSRDFFLIFMSVWTSNCLTLYHLQHYYTSWIILEELTFTDSKSSKRKFKIKFLGKHFYYLGCGKNWPGRAGWTND